MQAAAAAGALTLPLLCVIASGMHSQRCSLTLLTPLPHPSFPLPQRLLEYHTPTHTYTGPINPTHPHSPLLPRQPLVVARAGDPDAPDQEDDDAAKKAPPSLFWRVFSAFCYLIPWIDSISLGRAIYRRFKNLLVLYFVPGPMAKIYFSSQFAPLIIFFVMFLSVVKNKNLHHFVRFNCMQASGSLPVLVKRELCAGNNKRGRGGGALGCAA
jgi:hypothetical protein